MCPGTSPSAMHARAAALAPSSRITCQKAVAPYLHLAQNPHRQASTARVWPKPWSVVNLTAGTPTYDTARDEDPQTPCGLAPCPLRRVILPRVLFGPCLLEKRRGTRSSHQRHLVFETIFRTVSWQSPYHQPDLWHCPNRLSTCQGHPASCIRTCRDIIFSYRK